MRLTPYLVALVLIGVPLVLLAPPVASAQGDAPSGAGAGDQPPADQPGDEPGGIGDQPGDEPGGIGDEPGGIGDQPGDEPGGIGDQPGDEPGGIGDQPGDEPGGIGEEPGTARPAPESLLPEWLDENWRVGGALPSANGITGAGTEPSVSGSFSTAFRMRRSLADEDLDLYNGLSLSYGDPDDDEAFYATALMRVLTGLGNTNLSAASPLPDTNAGYNQDVRLIVYEAYARFAIHDPLTLTVGRQDVHVRRGPMFDGATASVRLNDDWRLEAFGGVPYYPYGQDQTEDSLIGGRATWRAYRSGRQEGALELETLYLKNHATAFSAGVDTVRVSLAGWYRTDTWNVRLELTQLEDQFQELRLSGLANVEAANLAIRGTYIGAFNPYRDFSIEFAEFEAVVGAWEPYHQFSLSLTHNLDWLTGENSDEQYAVVLELDLRQLIDARDVGAFNHEFFRWSLGVTADNPGSLTGVSASVFLNHYQSEGELESYAFTGELAWQDPRVIRVAAGAAYDLYRFDRITLDEQQDVYTVFGDVRAWFSKTYELRLRYEYQITGDDLLHSVQATVVVPF